MKRHYYISDDLKDLQILGQELQDAHITRPQYHVLSDDDAGVKKHKLHQVQSLLKKDVIHSSELGAMIGAALGVITLCVCHLVGMTETTAGWYPFIFLSVIIFGFCTWEGGLIGIQTPHYQFARFQSILKKGKHVFFVDVDINQESTLSNIINRHPKLKIAGLGEATPKWVIRSQDNYSSFMKMMP